MPDMKVLVTFRNTRASAALRRYAEEKIYKLDKFFYHPAQVHVVLSVDSKNRHQAEVTLQVRRMSIHGREETKDLYSAIDLVMEKIERQVKKYKARLQRRRGKG